VTTVVALQGKGWASIACDSRATEGPRPYTLPKEVCKVVKNGPYLIGVTGDLQYIPLIEYSFSPTSPQTDISVKELDRFMTTVFIPEYRDFLKETSMNTKEDADIGVPGALVLINGIIYDIDSTFTWLRDPSGIYSEGSGESYAHGSLLTSIGRNMGKLEIVDAKKFMIEAITNAIKLDLQTGFPIHTFVQLSKTKK
jgi:hypothetical protein